jgi:hypothetical protein
MAPRQHLRQTQQKAGGFREIARAVREYREKFPDKAITFYADRNCPSRSDGWAVLMGGGSLADVQLPAELAAALPAMRPLDGVVTGAGRWCLGDEGREYLVHADEGGEVELTLPAGAYRLRWTGPNMGVPVDGGVVNVDGPITLDLRRGAAWLSRQDDPQP